MIYNNDDVNNKIIINNNNGIFKYLYINIHNVDGRDDFSGSCLGVESDCLLLNYWHSS